MSDPMGSAGWVCDTLIAVAVSVVLIALALCAL